MNKYVIELRPDCKVVQQICESDGNVSIGAKSINYLEELNSDYINEHFSDLQDTAYQKGFEDGKAVHDKGCEGCKYANVAGTHEPCVRCSNSYGNQWTAKDDKIEVGDELTAYGGLKCIATIADYENDIFYVVFADGSCGKKDVETLKKTGRHFDIASILEEMRHD